jgi:DNA-binding beta-propeller fold protein YncE
MPDPKLQWPVEPSAIKRDLNDRLFIADSRNDRVLVFDDSLKFERSFGEHGAASSPGTLRRPTDLAFSRSGAEVFVVDSLNRRVQVFDRSGRPLRQLGKPGTGQGEFRSPFGIAAGRDGFVYVTDIELCRVSKFDEVGTFIADWSQRGSGMGELWEPRGIGQDDQLRLFVVDQGNHRAQIFNAEGRWLVTFGAGRAYTPKNRPPATTMNRDE